MSDIVSCNENELLALDMSAKLVEPCSDAVSRQAVKDWFCTNYCSEHNKCEHFEKGDCNAMNELFAIPPVNPQPKTGHWIEHDWEEMREKGYYRCSVCNHGYQRYTKGIRKSDVSYIDGQKYTLWNIDNFCPNCGARMESEEETE